MALATDKHAACVHVENSYPPFQNKFTFMRSGDDGTTIGSGPDCALVSGSAPTATSATTPANPVTVKTNP